jgi:hypothetical protein
MLVDDGRLGTYLYQDLVASTTWLVISGPKKCIIKNNTSLSLQNARQFGIIQVW